MKNIYPFKMKLEIDNIKPAKKGLKIIDYNPQTTFIDMLQYKADKEDQERLEDERLMEQQYEEFINLLQYFANVKDAKYKIIHINVNKNRTYTFKDEGMNNIDVPSVLDGSPIYHYDDMIVSNMIAISSKKYIVYGSEYWSEDTKKALMRIFEDKIELC